jgi:hypothetical protein
MARRRFIAFNGPAPTTARISSVTTGTAIKTMLQLKPTTPISILEWGYSFDTVPAAVVHVELITTNVGATVTDFVAADLIKYGDAGGAASAVALTTDASGYTSTAEGSITSARPLAQRAEWGQSFFQQFPLDREPQVQANDFLRIRATTATAINMLCYIVWEE